MLAIGYAKKTASPKTDKQKNSADVNGDGVLDSKDTMKIIKAAKTRTGFLDPITKHEIVLIMPEQ